MKDKIHPKYEPATIECACGNVFETRSTKGSFRLDVCSACHPFFTGTQKLIDTQGRVERFRNRYAKVQELQAQRAKAKKAAETSEKPEAK